MPDDFQPYLAKQLGKFHYLGAPKRLVAVDDVAELPKNAKVVELGKNVENLDQLAKFTSITRVACDLLDEATVKVLAKLPKLRHLDLSLSRATELPSLKPLKQLRVLVLYSFPKLETLEFLRGMVHLHSLCLSEVMAAGDLSPVGTLRDLREFEIDGTLHKIKFVDSLAPLGKLKRLRFLLLACAVKQENRTLRPLAKLKELKQLIIGGKHFQHEYDWLLDRLPQLPGINLGTFNPYQRTK